MNTCIEITLKDGTKYRPALQFEYDDIQTPIVLENDERILISYFRQLTEWDLPDPWPVGFHCQIFKSCQGYFDPMHLAAYDDEGETDLSEFFELYEDGDPRDFKLHDTLPSWGYKYLRGHCHSVCVWGETDNVRLVDAVLYVSPAHLDELRKTMTEEQVREYVEKHMKECRRILDCEPYYEHDTIEIDKKTMSHDWMPMCSYLREENCAEEMLMLDGYTKLDSKLVDLEELITSY